MKNALVISVVATVLGVAGCASKEDPAKEAVAQAESALAELRADAAKFAPAELTSAEALLAEQKQRLSKEEYKEVLEAQPKLATEVNTLKETVVAKQTQIAASTLEWERLKKHVPTMITSIENQIEAMKGTRLPKEVTKDAFESAKADLAAMKAQWA